MVFGIFIGCSSLGHLLLQTLVQDGLLVLRFIFISLLFMDWHINGGFHRIGLTVRLDMNTGVVILTLWVTIFISLTSLYVTVLKVDSKDVIMAILLDEFASLSSLHQHLLHLVAVLRNGLI